MTQTHACWQDHEREEGTLTRVEKYESGNFAVTSSNGWSIGVDAEYGVEPKVGDHFVTWGSIGRPVRGMALNRQVLYFRTPAQQDREDQMRADAHKAQRIAEYEGKRAEWNARVAALPDPLRLRVEGFREFKGDAWRWEFEPYEMACCEEAARLVARFTTGEAIQAFSEMEYAEQKAAHPNMDDGHSGNTWGMSKRLAWLTAEKPDLVPREHAAMCALAGCESAGCWTVRPHSLLSEDPTHAE